MRGDFMTFAERLKFLRCSIYLTQAELSALSGIPLGTIKGWETDRQYPTLEHFSILEEFLKQNGADKWKTEELRGIYLKCKTK